jgi:prepilin-type N-terminal cleavage/methylation domain-containing protein/prepilin-type processing-associated H-X9-DG protein
MKHRGFTLIELLVVVAIIALLVSILVPALSGVRSRAKATVCMSNLRQIGLSLRSYADENGGQVPCGAAKPSAFVPEDVASNLIWSGPARSHVGIGIMLSRYVLNTRIFFCPADDSSDLQEELPKIGTDSDAYCSYLYRNRDEVERQLLEQPGNNGEGVPAHAWVMDINSFGAGPALRTNHGGRRVHILFGDGSVGGFENRQDIFSIRPEDFAAYPSRLPPRLDAILRAADRAYACDTVRVAEPNQLE